MSARADIPPASPPAGAPGHLDYYRRRASAYDRIYERPERQGELRGLQARMGPWFSGRSVLELACGTGWWTPYGARAARRWLATDLNPEAMALARARPLPATVAFREVDAFTLDDLGDEPGSDPFDAAFAGFWWSHVPRARLATWLGALHARLAPGARVMMLDNRYLEGSSTPIARVDADGDGWQHRRLDDGSTHAVLKNFPSRDEALAVLGARARQPAWQDTPHYWCLTYTLD